jgi:hypothetical protein
MCCDCFITHCIIQWSYCWNVWFYQGVFLVKSPLSFLAIVALPRISQKIFSINWLHVKNWWKNRPKTFFKLSKCDKTFPKILFFLKKLAILSKKNTECVNLYSYIPCWYAVACWWSSVSFNYKQTNTT